MATIRDVVEGLKILARHAKPNTQVCGEHDIIMVGDVVEGELTEAERVELEGYGWHWDTETDSWARFT